MPPRRTSSSTSKYIFGTNEQYHCNSFGPRMPLTREKIFVKGEREERKPHVDGKLLWNLNWLPRYEFK